jgi:hypothetical protein
MVGPRLRIRRGEERRGEACTCVLVWKPEGKRPLGRPKHRREDNIKINLKEAGRGCMGWIELNLDSNRRWALVNAVMKLRVP